MPDRPLTPPPCPDSRLKVKSPVPTAPFPPDATTTKKRVAQHEVTGCRLFITSRDADEANRHTIAGLIRKHWSMENKVHWPRDAVLAEDRPRCRLPTIASALALLRTSLLALVHASGFSSVTLATEHFAHTAKASFNAICHQRLTSLGEERLSAGSRYRERRGVTELRVLVTSFISSRSG